MGDMAQEQGASDSDVQLRTQAMFICAGKFCLQLVTAGVGYVQEQRWVQSSLC
jgi:hypothetical protein